MDFLGEQGDMERASVISSVLADARRQASLANPSRPMTPADSRTYFVTYIGDAHHLFLFWPSRTGPARPWPKAELLAHLQLFAMPRSSDCRRCRFPDFAICDDARSFPLVLSTLPWWGTAQGGRSSPVATTGRSPGRARRRALRPPPWTGPAGHRRGPHEEGLRTGVI